MTVKIDLSTLNTMDADAFIGALGAIFEHSPWVAAGAYPDRPFATVDALHRSMVKVVEGAADKDRLGLLCAHPELAGREAREGDLTQASTDEQSSAGLNALSKDEMARVAKLNAEYRSRFGFPFIIAVRNYTREGIFAEWRRRLKNHRDTEMKACLEQVYNIARIRLDSLVES